MGVVWEYLDPLEVVTWQALDKWMYDKAVSRAQTRFSVARKVYFLRDRKTVVDEVSVSSPCLERQRCALNQNIFYTQIVTGIFYL